MFDRYMIQENQMVAHPFGRYVVYEEVAAYYSNALAIEVESRNKIVNDLLIEKEQLIAGLKTKLHHLETPSVRKPIVPSSLATADQEPAPAPARSSKTTLRETKREQPAPVVKKVLEPPRNTAIKSQTPKPEIKQPPKLSKSNVDFDLSGNIKFK